MKVINWEAHIEWKLEDMWIGVFWKKIHVLDEITYLDVGERITHIWICLIPTLPLHIIVYWENAHGRATHKNKGWHQ